MKRMKKASGDARSGADLVLDGYATVRGVAGGLARRRRSRADGDGRAQMNDHAQLGVVAHLPLTSPSARRHATRPARSFMRFMAFNRLHEKLVFTPFISFTLSYRRKLFNPSTR